MCLRLLGILVFSSLLLLAGCSGNEQISGKAFIKREKLVDVLVDIHLMDGVTNDRKFHRRYDADSIDLLTPILEKHHTTRTMFDTTMAIYCEHPDLFDQVYADVLIRLNVMLDKNDKDDGEVREEVSRPAE